MHYSKDVILDSLNLKQSCVHSVRELVSPVVDLWSQWRKLEVVRYTNILSTTYISLDLLIFTLVYPQIVLKILCIRLESLIVELRIVLRSQVTYSDSLSIFLEASTQFPANLSLMWVVTFNE